MATSTSATSPIDVCTRSLVLIGAQPMTSFDDGSNEALVAVNLYEDTAQASLVNTRWRFAVNQAVANRLSDAPTGRWDASYQIPSDSLMVNTVTINDRSIEYQIYGNFIFNNATVNDEVIIDYNFRQDESRWPSYFTQAVVYELAGHFALSLARNDQMSNNMFDKARFFMQKARTLDSQQQTTLKLNTNRFITARRQTGNISSIS
tara:strand:- start:8276 stop:8890 length:615 start_codon:yes stop_codon:yes gene_type:complete